MKKKIYLTAVAAIASAIVGAICFVCANIMEFDRDVGYFTKGGIFSILLYVCLAVGAASGIAAWVFSSKRELAKIPETASSISDTVIYALVGIGVAFCGAWDAMQTFSGDIAAGIGGTYIQWTAGAGNANIYAYMHYILWVLCVICTVFFLLGAVKKDMAGPMRILCGFSMTLFLAARVLVAYFDKSVAVNSPVKILFQVALVCIMLTFTEEAGIVLNRAHIYPRLLFAFCVSAAFAGTIGIGGVAACLMGHNISPVSVADGVLMCILFAYSVLHLRMYAKADTSFRVKGTAN